MAVDLRSAVAADSPVEERKDNVRGFPWKRTRVQLLRISCSQKSNVLSTGDFMFHPSSYLILVVFNSTVV